jgi:hypothetical protein
MLTLTVTREQFERSLKKLKELEVAMKFTDSTSGLAVYNGIEVHFRHIPNTLTLTVVRRPFLVPLSTIEEKLKQWFDIPAEGGA